ncbi:aldose 1-epimerase [Cetobacterium ceti]|uniref:Aldose 1-epimerase n=1 Tax=Cetobacterium ceti TaxID=180163 RepID=A0A1T4MWN5_9FUSO|nr:aldose epimerase family protein [Cetobacterium ceti]SJZ71217.1 aldose 1-epimerase [Cetobacterium ceti]
MEIIVKKWGHTKDKEEVLLYKVKNEFLHIEFLNYGGIIRKISTPDKNGNFENIVLGFNSIEEYEENPAYFGAIIGRNAGRIKSGLLKIKDKVYNLNLNNGNNNIHGGIKGLHNKIWKSSYEIINNKFTLTLKTTSSHLEEGFPGNINFTVIYILEENTLSINYLGTTDMPTYLNLTNHTYFNLSGNLKNNILSHKIKLNSEKYIQVDSETLPREITLGKDSFNLKEYKFFKDIFNSKEDQIEIANKGFDHPFILEKNKELDGVIIDSLSKRKIEFFTDQPVVVIYTGNYLQEIKNVYDHISGEKYLGFCLETQDYPDVLNFLPNLGKITTKDNPYIQNTKFIFSLEK